MESQQSLPLNGQNEQDSSDNKYLPKRENPLIMTSTTLTIMMLGVSFIYFASGQLAWIQASSRILSSKYSKSARPPILYGHIHVAKTGGTTLNRKMALHFEHVCGHKGYSYDAIQADLRHKQHKYQEDPEHYDIYSTGVIDEHYGAFSRDRVPPEMMEEIGYEDCDWVSTELSWQFWEQFQEWHYPVQLHVPCRDPVDLLLSQCNHLGKTFNCEAHDIEEEIRSCEMGTNRFSFQLQEKLNFDMKCFDYSQFDGYLEFMEDRMDRRRIQVDYTFRPNRAIPPRDRENECLWKNPQLIEAVHSYMQRTSDYYAFCNECMGSPNDLFLGSSKE